MKHSKLLYTKPGETIVLKAERAIAYGYADTRLTYVTMRAGRTIGKPFVVAHELGNPAKRGIYKLSDFQ